MSACSHRLRLKVRHGGLQLWLIGMRLEGTEGDTHTHTHTFSTETQTAHHT